MSTASKSFEHMAKSVRDKEKILKEKNNKLSNY